MDEWNARYLEQWKADFRDEPDSEKSFAFLKAVLRELKALETTANSSPQSIASSLTTIIIDQQDPEESLLEFQAVLFEAAISSPLDSRNLADVTRSLVQGLPSSLAEKLQYNIASNARERWNGPDSPSPKKDMNRCIQEWVALNTFVAHLTQVRAVPLEDYALRAFNRAFHSDSTLDKEADYHIPAAGAWIRILGKEIYVWSTFAPADGLQDVPFNQDKWNQWKRGFEAYSNCNHETRAQHK
ncbi:hypothetical protein BDV25DRAFT_132877 [Aspergillus avenaceus]|uniref:Uncharacterized protein n=1 Tax=Aspergillus avenaceus TaxID=36643 RepID=A0A5N6TJK7_ASPAV|nr:hypothetical protein BDV25DRAFT_132877 [Aspergillus avenaceus]